MTRNQSAILFCAALFVVVIVGLSSRPQLALAQLANPTAFSQNYANFVPNDATEFAAQSRGIVPNASGTLATVPWQSSSTCASAVSMTVTAGAVYPISAKFICDTGTDATSVTVLY